MTASLFLTAALLPGDPASSIRKALLLPDQPPPLASIVHSSFEPEPGIVAERITYSTQYGMRVPAILYRSKASGVRRPALIVVNGHGGDKFSWYAFYTGVLYARAGAVVLTYDPLGEGERHPERKSGTRAHDKLEVSDKLGPRVGTQLIADVMQAVSYLRSRPDVDGARIAAAGYSLGSFLLSLTCAVETRLHACVLVGGGNLDGPGGYWDRSKPLCQGLPYKALGFLGDRPAVLYSLHAERGPTLVYNGLRDTTVAIPPNGKPLLEDIRRRVIAARGSSKNVLDLDFDPDAAHRPFFVTRPVALWLEEKIDFPAWTKSEIDAMPVTHISDWAAKNSVEMDPLYATEEREGGTRALGQGAPGIRRADLFVLPEKEWEADRARFTIDSWERQVLSR